MRSSILIVGLVMAVGGVSVTAGCGGGVAAGRPSVDAADEGQRDAAVEMRPPGIKCPALVPGESRNLGACCTEARDCAGGVCWNGFCTKACVSGDACGAVTGPSPLPVGTPMACAPNMIGDGFSYCLPGSLRACAAPGTGACPKGEDCALGLSPEATEPTAATAYAGLCLTRLMADAYAAAGGACQPEEGPYACENQGGYLGSGCVAHRCTRACSVSNDCPVGMQCQAPPYSVKLGGAVNFSAPSGAGICLGRFCGQVHGDQGLAVGQVIQQGADAACPKGDVCVPTIAVGATGDTQYLSCVPSRAGALAYGELCAPGALDGQPCVHDSLCVERGGQKFCSALCRNDADCADGSLCVDGYPSPPLPNGSVARLSMCTPRALIGGRLCHTERECAATEACRPLGTHSSQLVCQATSGTKSVGETCAAATECRGGECFDRDLRPPTGRNSTSCSGPCRKNSDCGAGQICTRVVRNNNGTADNPLDDIVAGTCTPLDAPALTGGCTTNDNCTGQVSIDEAGGDTCDPTHHTCFTKDAHIGDPCTQRADCPLGGYCRLNDPLFPGGACLSVGCDPIATSGADACPVGAACGERGTDTPLRACYPACTPGTACARASEGYFCQPLTPAANAPFVCMWQGGT